MTGSDGPPGLHSTNSRREGEEPFGAGRTPQAVHPVETDAAAAQERADAEQARVFALMRSSSEDLPEPPPPAGDPTPEWFEAAKRHRLAVLAAQRSALLDARDNGTFGADVLEHALANLDAAQIDLELRGSPVVRATGSGPTAR